MRKKCKINTLVTLLSLPDSQVLNPCHYVSFIHTNTLRLFGKDTNFRRSFEFIVHHGYIGYASDSYKLIEITMAENP